MLQRCIELAAAPRCILKKLLLSESARTIHHFPHILFSVINSTKLAIDLVGLLNCYNNTKELNAGGSEKRLYNYLRSYELECSWKISKYYLNLCAEVKGRPQFHFHFIRALFKVMLKL